VPAFVLTRLAVVVSTFGYIGYFPVAPGTAGSVAGLVLYGLLRWLQAPPAVEAAVIALLFGIGVWSGTHAERYFGSTDPGPGVIDEVVGMLITLFMLPATWGIVIAGFFVFRVLDVVKPFPARRFESFHGGMGMMADDVMSALYANAAMRILLWIAPNALL
jgi:phosphatidylglycerophosphatase A